MNDEAGTLRAETPSPARSRIAALSATAMVALGAYINARWPNHPGVTPPAPALMVDFGLVAAYATFLIATASAGLRGRPATRVLAIGAIVLTIIAVAADVIENVYGLKFPNGFSLEPATIATAVKWGYFFAAVMFAGGVTALAESRVRQVGGALMVFAGALGLAGSVGGVLPLRNAGVVLATLGALVVSLLPYVVERRARNTPATDTSSPWTGQLDAEKRVIDDARGPRPGASSGSSDRFGLALSGGGIRSATFNLGLLQALDGLEVLHLFDYLATVSGGGYIGAFWSAWRSRSTAPVAPGDPIGPFPKPAPGEVEASEVRHLREFSNFLSPRLGVLSYDTGRIVVAAVSATLPALAAALALILLGLEGWLALAWSLLGRTDERGLPQETSIVVVGLIAGILLLIVESVWVKRERDDQAISVYVAATSVAMVLSAMAWWSIKALAPLPSLYGDAWPLLPVISETQPAAAWLTLVSPAGAWLAAALVLVVGRWTIWSASRDRVARAIRSAFDRVMSRLLFMTIAWIVISSLWILGAVLWHWLFAGTGSAAKGVAGLAGTATALGVAFRTVQRVFARQPNKPSGGQLAATLKPKIPQFIAYATIALMAASAAAAIIAVGHSSAMLLAALVVPIVITLATLFRFEPNEVGLHSFYRARLSRAFLGASNLAAGRKTEEDEKDDMYMDDVVAALPLHLVCCAANDLDSADHLINLHRGAVSSVLSPLGFSVGSDFHPWGDDHHMPTLGSAITASGAAFNSHMGSKSMELGAGVTFLMTALNLRLGMWLPHPKNFGKLTLRWLPGYPLYREMFGLSRAAGPSVLLSDGGHFENMALYELIRRRCRFILAADCGADPDVGFDDLGNFVRRVREDFNVEIDIDVSPLRPDATDRAKQPMVAGDIHYDDGTLGVLLLIKPTIVGNEPIDILQYKRRNETFPHESTGDQFYDEAQWESYRRLGEHAGLSAMQRVTEALAGELPVTDVGSRRWGARLFARARMFWQPLPEGVRDRLPAIVGRIADLDKMLHGEACARILPQVYREVDELDREVRRRDQRPIAAPIAPAPNVPAMAADARGNGVTVLPPPADLAPSLHIMRQAILFMEETFISEDLERLYNHPVYLGLMNYFARWTYAPVFRMWWPLLRSMYTRRFTSFMERMYDLESVTRLGSKTECVTVSIDEPQEGFAMHCWRLDKVRHRAPRPGEIMLGFNIHMHYENPYPPGVDPYKVQAALARVRVVESDKGTVGVWTAGDFYVPPGLWGMGIGERFLDLLVRQDTEESGMSNVGALLVAIPQPVQSRGASRKEGADLTTMYRAAGFYETDAPADVVRVMTEPTANARAGEPAPAKPRWMRLDRIASTSRDSSAVTTGFKLAPPDSSRSPATGD